MISCFTEDRGEVEIGAGTGLEAERYRCLSGGGRTSAFQPVSEFDFSGVHTFITGCSPITRQCILLEPFEFLRLVGLDYRRRLVGLLSAILLLGVVPFLVGADPSRVVPFCGCRRGRCLASPRWTFLDRDRRRARTFLDCDGRWAWITHDPIGRWTWTLLNRDGRRAWTFLDHDGRGAWIISDRDGRRASAPVLLLQLGKCYLLVRDDLA